jgi:hypothetical protein
MATPSIRIYNNTSENIRVAIFKKSYRQPTLGTVAWQIVEPPQGGFKIVPIPTTYEVFANYPGSGDDPNDSYAGYQTAQIALNSYTGRFIVNSTYTTDNQAVVASLTQVFTDLVPNEIHIENQAGFGVWGHITKSGADIFPPQIIAPGSVLIEDVRPTLYVAVVSQFVFQGSRLVDEEISATATPIIGGQNAAVTGSIWTGYNVSVTDSNG